ncbi:MAG: MFS transporter [Promethearchaeota archaeon]|nr:MAG: MFS transporter [Candidatus Lokiarchaeota archaeon]
MKFNEKKYDLRININAREKEFNPVGYRSNIFKLYLYNFFMGFYLLSGVILPFYLIWGELTFIQFIFLQSYYALIILLFQIPFGALSDYISKKLALILSGFLSAIATLIYINKPNFIIFLVGETLFALGEALIAGTNESLMYDSLKNLGKEEDYSKSIAKSNSIFLLSMAISAPLGPIIAIYFSFSMVMVLMFFPNIFGAIIALTFVEPLVKRKKQNANFFTILNSGFKELKKNRILRILTFDMIIIEILVFFLLFTYQLYLYQLHVAIIYFGIIASSYYVLQIIFINFLPKLENRFKNKKNYLILNTITPGIAYILIGIILFIPLIMILILVIFGFGFSRYIIFINGINNQIEIENRATVLNTISTIKLLLKVIFLPVIGFLVSLNLHFLFILIGVLIIFLALNTRVKKDYL